MPFCVSFQVDTKRHKWNELKRKKIQLCHMRNATVIICWCPCYKWNIMLSNGSSDSMQATVDLFYVQSVWSGRFLFLALQVFKYTHWCCGVVHSKCCFVVDENNIYKNWGLSLAITVCGWSHRCPVCVFRSCGSRFRSPLSDLLCFLTVCFIAYISLVFHWWYRGPLIDQTDLWLGAASELRVRFHIVWVRCMTFFY